jgi:hypothetical protein
VSYKFKPFNLEMLYLPQEGLLWTHLGGH